MFLKSEKNQERLSRIGDLLRQKFGVDNSIISKLSLDVFTEETRIQCDEFVVSIVVDRGTIYLDVIPRDHSEDRFGLAFLAVMLDPGLSLESAFDNAAIWLAEKRDMLVKMFASPYYAAHRAAYVEFERQLNRALLGLR